MIFLLIMCVPVKGWGFGGMLSLPARSLLQWWDHQCRGHAQGHGVPSRLPVLQGFGPGAPALSRSLPYRLLLPWWWSREYAMISLFFSFIDLHNLLIKDQSRWFGLQSEGKNANLWGHLKDFWRTIPGGSLLSWFRERHCTKLSSKPNLATLKNFKCLLHHWFYVQTFDLLCV